MPSYPCCTLFIGLVKNLVIEVKRNEKLKYTYFNSQEGYEDRPENYSLITYIIDVAGLHKTKLTFLREHIPIEFEQQNQQKFLPFILEQLKQIAEQETTSV